MANSKRVALVTGGNKGLGLEIARQLGEAGVVVIITARDLDKAQQAAQTLEGEGLEVSAIQLDVTRQEHIDWLRPEIERSFGRLDILVNNAGQLGEEQPSVEEFRQILEANLVGPYAIIEALLPLLKASPAGRIVNHSSIVGSFAAISRGSGGRFANPGYTTSKVGLNMLTVLYAQRLKTTNIKVNSAHPGWIKTDLGGDEAPLTAAVGARTAVSLALLDEAGPTGGFFHMDKALPW